MQGWGEIPMLSLLCFYGHPIALQRRYIETSMSLTPEQERIARRWLNTSRVSNHCPACGMNGPWLFGDLISPLIRTAEGVAQDRLPAPLVQRVCQGCGYVMLFSAKVMGVEP